MKTLVIVIASVFLSGLPAFPTEETKAPNVFVPRNKKDLKRK